VSEISRVVISGYHPFTRELLCSVSEPWEAFKASTGHYSRITYRFVREACYIRGPRITPFCMKKPIIRIKFLRGSE
jgi:hypothetical protein